MAEKRKHRPRARGQRAAALLASRMMRDRSLPLYRQELVRLAGRLLVHAYNASNSLYFTGEALDGGEGEPRVLLSKLLDLSKESRELLARAFPGEELDANDPLALLMGRDGK